MQIYIPTYGRVGRQRTLASLPQDLLPSVCLVVRPEEADAHHRNHPKCEILICDEKGVPAARQAAIEHCQSDFCFMLDDDLVFAVRPSTWDYLTGDVRLIAADADTVANGMEENLVEMEASGYGLLGFSARSGNQNNPNRYKFPDRIMRAFGVNVRLMQSLNIRFDKYLFWEDFHVALSFLAHGVQVGNDFKYTNDAATNSPGGVSTYRKAKVLREVRELFCAEHPFAKPVDKTTKSWKGDLGENGVIPDLRIQWQQAALAGGAL